jgi:hypothetical protein
MTSELMRSSPPATITMQDLAAGIADPRDRTFRLLISADRVPLAMGKASL